MRTENSHFEEIILTFNLWPRAGCARKALFLWTAIFAALKGRQSIGSDAFLRALSSFLFSTPFAFPADIHQRNGRSLPPGPMFCR